MRKGELAINRDQRPVIRLYAAQDLARLIALREDLVEDLALVEPAELELISGVYWPQGRAWVIERSDKVIGFGRVDQVPGLSGVYNLSSFVAESSQQTDYRSFLLEEILDDLRSLNVRRLTYADGSQRSSSFSFLQSRGFELEHVESAYEMEIGDREFRSKSLPEGLTITTLGRRQAAEQFITLYDECFTGLPWYQPYDRAEVLGSLENPANLLFLLRGSAAIGFCWVHRHLSGPGEIEPLGLAAGYRRQGYGKHLLRSALTRLKQIGAARVQIVAWQENKAAIQLYTGLGFRHAADRFFLAFDL